MKLSSQAMGAIMMALQKCLMEETDILPLLEGMNFQPDGPSQSELIVTNPPVVALEGTEVNRVEDYVNQMLTPDDIEA